MANMNEHDEVLTSLQDKVTDDFIKEFHELCEKYRNSFQTLKVGIKINGSFACFRYRHKQICNTWQGSIGKINMEDWND